MEPEEAALGLRTLLQTLPPAGMSINEFAQTRDQADPYLYMRDFLMLEGEARIEAGVPHRIWSAGPGDARIVQEFRRTR